MKNIGWLFLFQTPHPSAFGCHLLPLEKALNCSRRFVCPPRSFVSLTLHSRMTRRRHQFHTTGIPKKCKALFGEPLPREPPKLAHSFRGTPTTGTPKTHSSFRGFAYRGGSCGAGGGVPCNVLLLLVSFEKVSFIYGNNSFRHIKPFHLGLK